MRQILSFLFLAAACTSMLQACSDREVDPNLGPYASSDTTNGGGTTPIAPSNYDEQYRPQVHYTPKRNWINDPNGLVYANGTYHLFYQYNPQGNGWGNMSWGHATSSDLLHWTEQSVALTRDALGDIFSGSAVVDKDNTAGFGKNAIVAIYTSAGSAQQQSIAYSTDGGNSFAKYDGNPVIASTSADFRDPKVFWYEAGSKWVMELATGNNHSIELWSSPDLKNWTKMSEFTSSTDRCNKGQWECPDLFPLDYKGNEKWVQLVSTNPGGPVSGSGTMYFIGSFDGTRFIADQDFDYPLWLDYGSDNYAGVTWNNTSGRRTYIGWMNNWNYAGSVPATPWRSAFTLPRDLKLIEYQGKPLLASTMVSETETLSGEWREATDGMLRNTDACQLQVTMPTTQNWTLTLQNAQNDQYAITYDAPSRRIIADRGTRTGTSSFAANFAIPSVNMPINTEGNEVTLDLYIDRSSVELLTSTGSAAMTNVVYPKAVYHRLSTTVTPSLVRVRDLKRVWP